MLISKPILLVEDSSNDRELITIALEKCRFDNPVVTVGDGEEALDYLFRRGAWEAVRDELPIFVLLDKKLPKIDGHDVLAAIRENERTACLPILMLTSSREESDLLKSYDLGFDAYVVKPVLHEEFMHAVKDITVAWGCLNEQLSFGARVLGQRMLVRSIDMATGQVRTDEQGD